MAKKPTSPRRRASDQPGRVTQTERLVRLEEGLGVLRDNQTAELQGVAKSLDGIRTDLKGLRTEIHSQQYGKDGKPGSVIKLDRLEQSMAQAKLVVRLMGGALITLVLGTAWAILTKTGLS